LAERNDPAALAAIQPLATGGAANVQREAVKALGKIGDKASVAVLVKLLQAGDGASDVAYASLRQMTAPDTDAAIMELAPAADAAVRVKLIDLLGMRAAAGAAGLLLKMAADADQATSSAAFQALSSVARPGDVPELIKLLAACKDEGAQEAARGALFAACMKTPNAEQRDAAVLAAYEEAKDSGFKCSLIKILGAIRTAKACEVIKKALSAGDEQVRDTALRTLANWPDASPVAALMEAVKGKSTDVHRVLALRGAARMAGLLAASAERDTPRVTELFKELGQAVKSDDDKKLFLSALANLTNVEGLTMLQPFLGDAAVQAEAETALVAMTGSPAMDYKPAKAKELAKAALEKVAASGKSSAARKKAAEIAKRIPAQ
jgi:HEAT repeat protein